jgi:hypothetical protein
MWKLAFMQAMPSTMRATVENVPIVAVGRQLVSEKRL